MGAGPFSQEEDTRRSVVLYARGMRVQSQMKEKAKDMETLLLRRLLLSSLAQPGTVGEDVSLELCK